MPQDNLLPQVRWASATTATQESFDFDGNNDTCNVVGACEPFKVVDPATTPTPSTHPPTGLTLSGGSLIGVVLAGLALIVGGTALIVLRRRRNTTEDLLP